MIHEIVKWNNGKTETWFPTTLDVLNKAEEFLEGVIAENPNLLGLETRLTGIRGPFIPFRQLSFQTPQKRSVRPDIVFLTTSGHVVIVEVKRHINPELRDRSVIAQSIDYAASFSAMDENEITALFNRHDDGRKSWPEFIQEIFPMEEDPDELSNALMSRFLSGGLNIVIACDKAPVGLDGLVKGVATQSALEFDLSVVEVTPYIQKNSVSDEIIFIPKIRIETEVVSRTVVTVTYRQDDVRPSVNVQTTSVEEIEENLRTQTNARKAKKQWDKSSFLEDLKERTSGSEVDVANKILKWAKDNSLEVKWGSGSVDGTFYPVINANESNHNLFGVYSNGNIEIVFHVHPLKTDELKLELRKRLNEIQGVSLHDRLTWARFPMSALEDETNLNEFFDIWKWAINIIQENTPRK